VTKLKTFLNLFVLLPLLSGQAVRGEIDAREKVIEFMRSADMGDKLDAPVRISVTDSGIISIADEGHFIAQHVVMQPELRGDVEVIKEPGFEIRPTCTKAVIVTHGWLDKGADSWPADIATAISQRVDPNEWVCGFFDWAGGASVVRPVDSAKYARDVAGLSFYAPSDHHQPWDAPRHRLSSAAWEDTLEAGERFNKLGEFLVFPAFEYRRERK